MAATRGLGRIGGTRGGVGRIAAMVIALAVAALLVLADAARAGTYEVARCGWGVGAELDRAGIAESWGAGVMLDHCDEQAAPDRGLRLEASPVVSAGGALRARWIAAPGTTILAVRGVWAGAMTPTFRQELGFDGAGGFAPLVATFGAMYPTPVAVAAPAPASAVEFRLACLSADLDSCRTTPPAWTLMRDLTVTVADAAAPRARAGGPLLEPGWHRGRVAVDLGADDAGAGIQRLEAQVGGAAVASAGQPCVAAVIEGEWRAAEMRPCEPAASGAVEVDTTGLPDGTDLLRGCAVDFAGNVGCSPESPARVDNSGPSLDFAAAEAGKVAATVFDPYSGPASGTLAMRRADSETWLDLPTEFRAEGAGKATLVAALPAMKEGAYVFRAQAADALGNPGEELMHVAGDPATIEREVAAAGQGGASGGRSHGGRRTRLRVRLSGGGGRGDGRGRSGGSALTLPFGAGAMLVGQLTDEKGAPVAGQTVKVLARSSSGAAPAPRAITTDAHGRFVARLPAGPSRHLVVSFPGGAGLAPARSRPLALRVRAAVSLTATPRSLRTGETVHLLGRVGHRGARIPGRGKLVAIQYLERDSGRWRPALVVRTGRAGRFHADYRFRYISGTARIRLRATALPEADWPYASGSSAPVTVHVHGG